MFFILGSKGRILANGYNVKDTTFPACSGGSAGGRIHLTADIVSYLCYNLSIVWKFFTSLPWTEQFEA